MTEVLLVANLIFGLATSCLPALTKVVSLLPDELTLARAEVVAVSPRDEIADVTLRINYIYTGSEGLAGREFSVKSSDRPPDGTSVVVTPQLNIGDSRIWLVKTSDDRERVIPVVGRFLGFAWPASAGEGEARRFAELVERLKNAEPDSAAKLFREVITGKESQLAAAAVELAARNPAALPMNFLRELVDQESIEVAARVRLDEALTDSEADWKDSGQRLTFLQRCVTGSLDQTAAEALVSHLEVLAQHRGMPERKLLHLLQAAILNEQMPMDKRQAAIAALGWAFERFEDDAGAFEFIVQCLTDFSGPLQRSAAYELLKRPSFKSEERLARLRELRIDDAETKSTLTQVLSTDR